jgi:hypothetical protein
MRIVFFSYSFVTLVICIGAYWYGGWYNEEFRAESVVYISIALVITCVASFAAVALSLTTYALGHQFYTGGGYFVKVASIPLCKHCSYRRF